MARQRVLGLPIGKAKRSGFPLGKVAGAAATVAAVLPVAQRAGSAVGKVKRMTAQGADALETAEHVKEAVSSHSSTIGKVGAVVSQAAKLGGKSGESGTKPKLSHLIEQHTDIAAPRTVVYNQWTQLEMLPSIMKGVESVEQDEDDKTKWTSKIGPCRRTWTGRIVEQVPDERIAWKSEGGAQHQGVVTFHSLDEDLTRVLVQMEYKPKGPFETVGNTLRIQRRRAKRDLRLFKHFIELRGEETGGWRGQIDKKEQTEPQFAGQGSGHDGGQGDQGGGRAGRGSGKGDQGSGRADQDGERNGAKSRPPRPANRGSNGAGGSSKNGRSPRSGSGNRPSKQSSSRASR